MRRAIKLGILKMEQTIYFYEIIKTDIEIASTLNNHFGTVFTSENFNKAPEFNLYIGKG